MITNASLTTLRRFFCGRAASRVTASQQQQKKPAVFLGSPQVAVTVLDALFSAAAAPNSSFRVAAVVTQPAASRGRGRKVLPSPVAQYALDTGFPSDLILTPERVGEDILLGCNLKHFSTSSGLHCNPYEAFLASLRDLQPELCITAAYGNILPTKFLNIPPLGTVNIHPSLLPLYRGAAPVQRALQDGAKETGVSLAFTVRALDAGPVIACERFKVNDQIKAPDLLALLFSEGSKLLVRELPSVFDGSARVKAEPQDDSKATLAPKITPEESWVSFDQEAPVIHNKVRAFAGWPGTRTKVMLFDDKNNYSTLELKIITTKICSDGLVDGHKVGDVTFNKGALVFPCGGSTALEVLEVQLPGKNVVTASQFWNGLRGQKVKLL